MFERILISHKEESVQKKCQKKAKNHESPRSSLIFGYLYHFPCNQSTVEVTTEGPLQHRSHTFSKLVLEQIVFDLSLVIPCEISTVWPKCRTQSAEIPYAIDRMMLSLSVKFKWPQSRCLGCPPAHVCIHAPQLTPAPTSTRIGNTTLVPFCSANCHSISLCVCWKPPPQCQGQRHNSTTLPRRLLLQGNTTASGHYSPTHLSLPTAQTKLRLYGLPPCVSSKDTAPFWDPLINAHRQRWSRFALGAAQG